MNNNTDIVIKAYTCRNVNPHATKKQLQQSMKPFFFPTYTPAELKGNKVGYILLLFPMEEIIAKILNKNNYDVGHIIPIININAWLCGWNSEGYQEIICH